VNPVLSNPILAILGGLMALVGSAGIGGLLKTWLDHTRAKRKQTDDVSLSMVQEMRERMASVEAAAERDRERAGEERMRAERRERLCDAKLSAEHHRVNNLLSIYQAAIMLVKVAPGNLPELADEIMRRREVQEDLESRERDTVLKFEADLLRVDERADGTKAAAKADVP
jgi:hypothetical protein